MSNPPPLRTISFELTRNQLIDMQRALKKMVAYYDDRSRPGRYVVTNLVANNQFMVQIAVDRAKDFNHPLQKKILEDTKKFLDEKLKEQTNVKNL